MTERELLAKYWTLPVQMFYDEPQDIQDITLAAMRDWYVEDTMREQHDNDSSS